MIEAIHHIGNIQKEKDFLEEFIDDPGDNNRHVFKIVVDISNDDPQYTGIDYEEFDSAKRLKYFYKNGSSNGPDKTPTAKITEIGKTINNKIKNVFQKYLNENKNVLTEEDQNFLLKMHDLITRNKDKIVEDLREFAGKNGLLKDKEGLNEPSLITVIFKKNEQKLYVGDMSLFVNVFRNNENEAYHEFYYKHNTESRANNKYCYICKNEADEVWGFVNTYNFYTSDKENYIAGGFNQELMWKNYPVCSQCAKILERGKKYIDEKLSFKFCGFNYLLIPELVIYNEDVLQDILTSLEKYRDFTLQEKKANLIEKAEERIIRELGKQSNQINFNFLFYKKLKASFKISLLLREIAPTRLSFLINAKDRIDNQVRKYPIFREIKGKKDTIDFRFSFSFIRDFFPNSEEGGNFDKYFFSTINNIFIGKKISMDFILSRFMDKIRSEFLNDNWIEPLLLKSYKILLYLEEIEVLDRRRGDMKNYQNNYEEFFQENPIFDNSVKKGLFLEGILAQKLLNIQFRERSATPFRSRLNGLKIDEKVAKRLLPEMINKLEEYGKNYYRELEETIGEYFIQSDFKKYSIDEMSYYFTLGMVLAKYFRAKEENEENEEQQ